MLTATDVLKWTNIPKLYLTIPQDIGGSIQVAVKPLNCREVYGRLDVQVRPTDGAGTVWVSAERLSTTIGGQW